MLRSALPVSQSPVSGDYAGNFLFKRGMQDVKRQWLHLCEELRKIGVLTPRIKVSNVNIRGEKISTAQSIAVRIESNPIFTLYAAQMQILVMEDKLNAGAPHR